MSFEYAYGAILGAFVGDAAGAPLEFYHGQITEDVVHTVMKMPGGGILRIGPGQITDDSELAMCLLHGLRNEFPKYGFPAERIAEYYHSWYLSPPFDMGNTTRNAVREQTAEQMYAAATKLNMGSKANGALMRITPLAVWVRNLPAEKAVAIISADTSLTHPNKSCVDASIAYSIAIGSLINYPEDIDRALKFVSSYLIEYGNEEVQSWFEESKSLDGFDCSKLIGFVRWGFTLAFHYLRKNVSYEEAIADTLIRGGDTDTNAAIVGGLIGALHGSNSIPEYMRDPVLNYNYSTNRTGYNRSEFYSPKQLKSFCEQLFSISK
ncbi:MAG: ADP-ribosylglycohydrolase family protein [Candidatus Heimdallarchaeota archaeon]|nr:ADP-ribosylglycohydrolase family protein [Candidatus Heimdallarchaeota archaeon]